MAGRTAPVCIKRTSISRRKECRSPLSLPHQPSSPAITPPNLRSSGVTPILPPPRTRRHPSSHGLATHHTAHIRTSHTLRQQLLSPVSMTSGIIPSIRSRRAVARSTPSGLLVLLVLRLTAVSRRSTRPCSDLLNVRGALRNIAGMGFRSPSGDMLMSIHRVAQSNIELR